jgi:transcriptional regulator with XRE-family HTH domain
MPSFIEIRIAIGKKIKELRISAEMTQNEFAFKLGISRQHLSSIENGSSNWTIDDLIKSLIYLKKIHLIDELLKESPLSPKEQFKLESKKRKRVKHVISKNSI